MIKFGGHKQAAGLTIEAARIRELRARVNDFADDRLGPDDLRPRLWIDGALGLSDLDAQVISELTLLAPYGAGNPNPIFRASRVEVVDGPRVLKDRHLKMAFKQDGRVMRGIAWRAREREVVRLRSPDGHRSRVFGRAGHLERRPLSAAVSRRFPRAGVRRGLGGAEGESLPPPAILAN